MKPDPRHAVDHTDRQVSAARRVLIDLGQVLASFGDAIVVVGGWVPDLLLPEAEIGHVGSIDVDLALDAVKLQDGRYADLLKVLLDTRRYASGDKDFQLVTIVDLQDREAPVRVDVEFLASADVTLKKNQPKLTEGFRVLQFPAFAAAFANPVSIELAGPMISGVRNTVQLRVAALPDFLIMKAHAIGGRDKPKDVYDFCYCLDEYPDATSLVASTWRSRLDDPLVGDAIRILKEKFRAVDDYGSQQLAVFHDSVDTRERAMHARRAFELVQKLLTSL
jgi:Nucleotidyl transferase AbiEii toxin, Type IV TA system